MNKNMQIVISSIFAICGLIASQKFLRRFRRYIDLVFYGRVNTFPLTLSESKEFLLENPQSKYLYLTGHILPADQQQTRFLQLQCGTKDNLEFKVNEFQLLDIQHNERKNIKINGDSILLRGLFDYSKSYLYQQENMSFIKKILNKIPILNKKSRIVETHKGVQFGQFTTMLCEKNGDNFNLLYLSNYNYNNIYNQIHKDMFNAATVAQLLFILVSFSQLIYLIIQKLQQKNDEIQPLDQLGPPVFKNSISVVLNSQNDQDICVICLTRTRSVILEPCLHFILCQDCVNQLDKDICPFCRIKIEKKIKVLYNE
ncbi:unnamed protein product (macronuclear) [Paramecium tetraurelia]|uniref:RING-type domain-containing protein n=1 Tax=Paramecium tetraurelia TaxID=5888 RepID=A0CDQ4_PARTE|nr:uncharacterized protein GSPATT00007133001 [Paramecium tetraurelia]CAK68921.1 unnamed protein product [Paramecium tetraurelia]|eukprot:XP_001436318.1 hypothetical protein (macronuclear) [Paramecium tetraurelia strain d4-2]